MSYRAWTTKKVVRDYMPPFRALAKKIVRAIIRRLKKKYGY